MASVVIDGLTVPLAINDDPVLNFCNTRAGWGEPTPKEYLHTHAHLTLWARETGLLDRAAAERIRELGEDEPAAATALLARTIDFRDALYAALLGTASETDWKVVNGGVRAAAGRARLRPGRPATWDLGEPAAVDTPFLAVAFAAGALLTSADAAHIAACPGSGCGWVFRDPRGRRRWCSMAWCGNRSKVRRHAQRQRNDEV